MDINLVKLILYMYCGERRDIRWNISWAQGKSRGQSQRDFPRLRLYFITFPDSRHNTDILNYKSSMALPGRSILEELTLHIASTAGQYWKILPNRLCNTEELNFNIIMFSAWECEILLMLTYNILHLFLCLNKHQSYQNA